MARHVQMTIEYDQHVYTGGEVCCVRLFCSLMQFSEPNNTVSANGHRDIMITEICLYVCQSDCLCVCVCVPHSHRTCVVDISLQGTSLADRGGLWSQRG